MGSEDGAPGLTLYEIDEKGWVHRQVQIHADGSRFSPEDILMRRPVNADYMAVHAASEEIEKDEFEMLWNEVDCDRSFCERIPNPYKPWVGFMASKGGSRELRWIASEGINNVPDNEWMKVPGFSKLYVRTKDAKISWAAQREVFLDRSIDWFYAD